VAVRRDDHETAGIDLEIDHVAATGTATPTPTGGPGADDEADTGDEAGASATAVDPVCGMAVEVDESAITVEHDGETYHFCGRGCADAFVDEPDRFVDDGGDATAGPEVDAT
jgi:xanthine dehydrogenase accessory factor